MGVEGARLFPIVEFVSFDYTTLSIRILEEEFAAAGASTALVALEHLVATKCIVSSSKIDWRKKN